MKHTVRIGTLIVGVVAALMAPSAAAASEPVDNHLYRISSGNELRCMHAAPRTTETPVIGANCRAAGGWYMNYRGTDNRGDYWSVAYPDYGECLLVRNFGSNAYKAVLYPCMNYADQEWYRVEDGPRTKLVNRAHDTCLVLRTWQTQLETSACAAYPDQNWLFFVVW